MREEPTFVNLTPAEAAEADRAAATNAAVFDFRKVALKVPRTGEEAASRLDALQKDPAWVGKLFNGDAAANREFHALTKLMTDSGSAFDPTAADARQHVPLIETVVDGDMGRAEQIRHAQGLREGFGLNNTMIREMMTGIDSKTGKAFTSDDAAVAQSALARDIADPDFARRASTRGTREAARVLVLNGIIAAGSLKN